MKKEVLIGILALAAIVIAGCTQIRERESPVKQLYGQGLTECEIISTFSRDRTGQTVCEDNGYTLCIEQKETRHVKYYDSTDGSCVLWRQYTK